MSPRYIALAPHAWGEGSTVARAIARAEPNVPLYIREAGYQIDVYEVGPEAQIDGHGAITYGRHDRAPELVTTVRKRGKRYMHLPVMESRRRQK